VTPKGDAYPRPRTVWAHFEVEDEIARGNMGAVFRARDRQAGGREVALKVLLLGRTDAEHLERFKREARSLARLAHRGIVAVHTYGVHHGVPFLTMDFVPGASLQELIDDGALSPAQAAHLLGQVARAIDHAHSRGVVHRDLKPANVLIGSDGLPRITDFGLAKITDGSITITQDGDLVGTPVYMSPEQIQGDLSALGPSSDVWALGVMSYLMLTGLLPFGGRTVDEVGRRVVQDEPRPPRELVPEVPEELERICLAALEKDPRVRYQSAGEMARDLEAFLHGRPVLAGRVTLAVRARRAGRFVRLHAVGFAFLGGCLLALLTLAVVSSHLGAASAETTARELFERAVLKREASSNALERGQRAWERSAPGPTRRAELAAVWDRAEGAVADAEWAAAYLDRAWRARTADDAAGLSLAEALEAPPGDDVPAGVRRDPALRWVYGRTLGLRGRIAAVDPDLVAADAAEDLLRAFAIAADPADLAALVGLARRRDDPALAGRARALLRAQAGVAGSGPFDPAVVELQAALARLGAWTPGGCGASVEGEAGWRCPVCVQPCPAEPDRCPHCGLAPALLERSDAAGGAARAARAATLLDLGAPRAALEVLGDDPAEHPLGRARAAAAAGELDVAERALAPLLARGPDPRALLERARVRIRRGRPRAALRDVERLPARDELLPHLAARRRLVGATARALLDGEADAAPLERLAAAPAAPVEVRVAAARLVRLLDPAAGAVEDLPAASSSVAPVERALARLAAAESADGVADALGRLALGRYVPETRLDRRRRPPEEVRERLVTAAHRSAEPLAAAGALVLLLDAGDADRARALWSRQPPEARAADPALGLAGSLLELPRPRRRERPAPPLGLATGRSALGAWLQARAAGEADATPERARAVARRHLDLAVRADPFHPGARLARARRHLADAAALAGTDEAAVERARSAALLDATAAYLVTPADPRAYALFLQALWVRDRDYEQLEVYLGTWSGDRLEPHVRLALANMREADRPVAERSFADRDDPTALRACRLQDRLVRAATGASSEEPAPPPSGAILARLRAMPPPLERAYLQAHLLLEDPAGVDALLRTPWSLDKPDLAELEHQVENGGKRAVVARIVRLVHGLQHLPEEPAARRRLAARAAADLDWVAAAHPSLAVTALRAAAAVWTRTARLDDLGDLLAWDWPGALYWTLRAIEQGRPADDPPGDVSASWWGLGPIEDLRRRR